MDNEAVDNFLDGLDEKVQDPFEAETKDPFDTGDKPAEKVEEEGEKPLPFNKDPKVQRYIEKEIDKRIKDIKPTETEKFIRETGSSDEDNYYERLIGNDTPEKVAMIKEAKARDERLLKSAEERAFSRLSASQQESLEEDRRAQEELQQGFEEIEETFNVDLTSNTPRAKQTRTEFVEFIRKIAPKDRNGEVIAFPDLNASFEEFQEKKKAPTNSRAKDLSSRSMSRSVDASKAPVTTDSSWNAVDKLFSKFNK